MSELPSPSLLERFVALLMWCRVPLLVLAIAATLASIAPSRRLQFDQSIESLYAADDPHLREFLDSKRWFGGDELALVAWEQPDLLDESLKVTPSADAEITALADSLSETPGVNPASTQALPQALELRFRGIKLRVPRETVVDMMTGILVGEDRSSTAVALRLEPVTTTPVDRGETIAEIREKAAVHEEETGQPTFVVGEPVQIHDMFRHVEEDGNRFLWWTAGLMATVVFVYFRSLRWTLLPLAVVAATILWTRATLVVGELKLSMVSSMLNSLVTIIGVATVTHITIAYRSHRATLDPTTALRRTFVELLPAVFWTCATTAVGFAALLSSHITPVRSFGGMMMLGTGFVFVAVCVLLPGGALLGRFDNRPRNVPTEDLVARVLKRIVHWIENHPRILGVTSAALAVVAAVGLFRLELESDFSKNFREDSDIIRSLVFVEERLGGAGTWEVNFPAPPTLDEAYLERVSGLANRIRDFVDRGDVTKVVSITDGLSLVPKQVGFGFLTKRFSISERLALIRQLQPEFESSLYDREEGRMRIVIRAWERRSAEEKRALIEEIEAIAREEFPGDAKTEGATATGLYVLLVFLIESLMSDQITSFAWATLGIGVMMTIAYRSLRIGLVALVPNVFPILLVIGGMGWFGSRVNIATAMISCVSMGLTTDATVHFIAAYRRARRSGLGTYAALDESLQGAGRAVVFATFALVVGFSVLATSHFVPLVYFGLLVSAAMIGGLVGDLIVLPLLLAWIDGDGRPTIGATDDQTSATDEAGSNGSPGSDLLGSDPSSTANVSAS